MGCLCMSCSFCAHVKRSHTYSSVHDELHCTVLDDCQGALSTRHALRTLRPAGVHGKPQDRLGSGPCGPLSLRVPGCAAGSGPPLNMRALALL